jgi:hypothetical protein
MLKSAPRMQSIMLRRKEIKIHSAPPTETYSQMSIIAIRLRMNKLISGIITYIPGQFSSARRANVYNYYHTHKHQGQLAITLSRRVDQQCENPKPVVESAKKMRPGIRAHGKRHIQKRTKKHHANDAFDGNDEFFFTPTAYKNNRQ